MKEKQRKGVSPDVGYLNMCRYMEQMSIVFIQCAPYLSDFLPQGHLIFQHRLFKDSLFHKWSKLAAILKRVIEKLRFSATYSLAKLKGLQFETTVNGNTIEVNPSSKCAYKSATIEANRMFKHVCVKLSKMASSEEFLNENDSTQVRRFVTLSFLS